ncbi:MAG: methyltransferase domain-containing protein, partial [Desulfobacterales bacterium]|nr:methyltransferase domain-containing protein [Desulfobacterales bacterium]
LFKFIKSTEKIIDINSGYGLCAVCLLEIYPKAEVYGIEPDDHRARIASAVTGQRVAFKSARLPDIPQVKNLFDCAVMIDLIQNLNDNDFKLILNKLKNQFSTEGNLLLRAPVPINQAAFWVVWYNNIWFKITGKKPCYRSKEQIEEVLLQSGFKIESVEPSGAGRKKCWILAKVKPNYNENS